MSDESGIAKVGIPYGDLWVNYDFLAQILPHHWNPHLIQNPARLPMPSD